ncbi:hypothetical protein [uncultured Thalassospira sp.]|uniref:hypothetical protein n=1 Tax=uncultured Thalassospira sp. TaxID=404382 RepID=UPI0030DBC77C
MKSRMRILKAIQVLSMAVVVTSYGQMTYGAQASQNSTAPLSWAAKKCQLFTRFSLDEAKNNGDLGKAFLARQDQFIQSGCVARIHVCPTSQSELDYANRMSIFMINQGATGSFLPFLCDQG